MPKESAAPSPPRRRRWWVRLFLWLMTLGFLFVVLAAAAIWWAWTHPERVAQLALSHVPGPFQPTASKIVVEKGALKLHDVVLTDTASGKVVLRAESIGWHPIVKELSSRKLGKLAVKGLRVDWDDSMLQSISGGDESDAATSTSGFTLDEVQLEDAHVSIPGGASRPSIEFTLDQHWEDIDVSDLAHPVVKQFRTKLRNAKIAGSELALATVDGHLTREGMLVLDKVECRSGRCTPSDALTKWLQQPATTGSSEPGAIKSIQVGSVELNDFLLETAAAGIALPSWWPLVKGRINVRFGDARHDMKSEWSVGSARIELNDVELKAPDDAGGLWLPKAELVMKPISSSGVVEIQEAILHKPVVNWMPSLEKYLLPEQSQESAKSSSSSSKPVLIGSLRVEDASLAVQRTNKVPYAGKASVDLQVNDLRLDDKGVTSAKQQTLSVRHLKLAEHPMNLEQPKPAFVELGAGTFSIVPDDWKRDEVIEELSLNHVTVTARNDTVSWFKPAAAASAKPAASTASSPTKIHAKRLNVTKGYVEYADEMGQRMEARAKVQITTENGVQKVRLEAVKGLLPQHAKLPVVGLETVEAVVKLPDLWIGKRLESLSVVGGEIDVGDALMSLAKTQSSTEQREESKPPVAPSTVEGWRVEELSIKDTAITLQRVAPGLPPVKFNIDYHGHDMPLDPAKLAGNFEPQRVELTQLAIKSPYEPLRNVAQLGTVFIDFTLDSLFKQRIDKVQIISPSLFVGEDLFWYIDYYRKYAAGQPLPGQPTERLASTDKMAALAAATAAAEAPVKEVGTWSVDTLQVDGGKLVVAPKGRPLPGIPRPFPFSFVTKMNQGKLEAEFEIPSDTYTWEQLKLQLERMRGKVLFNLPVKSLDNNLTETFNVDRIRYKQLHIEKAHLSVTYDMNGIYGQFGGEAYEGYVNGAFNIYMDASFTWDGWISGQGVRTTEITRQICPAYFLLDGKVDTTVVAQGDMNEIYQCDLKFKNASPGKFSIVALNEMLDSLPKDLQTYQQDLVKIGVETLRDFDYENVEAKCRFYGREGKGSIRLGGPTGSRNININIFDHRWNDRPGTGTTLNITNAANP